MTKFILGRGPPCNSVHSGHFCICNHVTAMQKTYGGHVHDCACMCARKRACMHWTYAAWIIYVFYDRSEYPTAEFPMSFMTCSYLVKNWRTCSIDQGRNLLQGPFCTGADTTAYANVSARTQLHYAAASGRKRLQNRPVDITAYAIMSSRYSIALRTFARDTVRQM